MRKNREKSESERIRKTKALSFCSTLSVLLAMNLCGHLNRKWRSRFICILERPKRRHSRHFHEKPKRAVTQDLK